MLRRPMWWRKPRDMEFHAWHAGSVVRSPAFHATSAPDFEHFDTSLGDLGSHFGSLEQAQQVAQIHAGERMRIVPVWLQLRKPLRLPDLGSFHPDAIAPVLERRGLLARGEGERIARACEANWRERKEWGAYLRERLQQAGYDGVVYRNAHEGGGESWVVFDSHQVRSALAPRPRSRPAQVLAPFEWPQPGDPGAETIKRISRALKNPKPQDLDAASCAMAALVPAGSTLVPVPSSDGGCAANLRLAQRIARHAGVPVACILEGTPRPSQYATKQARGAGLAAAELGFRLVPGAQVPGLPVLVDNVADSGQTLLAAREALGVDAPALAFAATRHPQAPHQVATARELGVLAPLSAGSATDPHDFSQDPAFHHLFYGEPTPQEVLAYSRWLRQHADDHVRLFHGTSALNEVRQEGLLPASATRRNSLQTASGYVCASVYPGMARQFGAHAAANCGVSPTGHRLAVYPVVVPVRRLLADMDQLNNQRAGGRDVGNSLAESLVWGHGARVRGRVEPMALRAAMLYRSLDVCEQPDVEELEDDVVAEDPHPHRVRQAA